MTDKNTFLEKARKGDVDATLICGWCYMFGYKGFPQDEVQALAWLEKARKLGSVDAFRCMGYLCETRGKFYDAVDYYEQGALRGDMQSGFIALGIMKSKKLELASSANLRCDEFEKLSNMITKFEKQFDEVLDKSLNDCKCKKLNNNQ